MTKQPITLSAHDVLPYLRRIPFFARVPDPALVELATTCTTTTMIASQVLFRQGDVGDRFYVILEGAVQILYSFQDTTLLINTLHVGDFFGEMALFDDAPRSATVRVIQSGLLLEIRKLEFQKILQHHPQIVGDALRVLSTRIRHTNLHRLNDLVRKYQELEHANQKLQKNNGATLHALSAALDLRDQATQGHSQRVTDYTLLIADALGDADLDRDALRLGAMLHDIGKIGVSDAILRKPSFLTPAEWAEMRKHPEWGAALIEKIELLSGARDIIIAHHEKFDGSGYPRGLRGEEIPLGARIFAVADVFDAVTTFRPYRDPISPQSALAMIRAQAGTVFDPRVVAAFERAFPEMVQVMHASFNS